MALFSRGFDSKPTTNEKDYDPSTFDPKSITLDEEPIVLDRQQEVIVHSDAKNIIVIAGAGSGKTRVLTERIRYLIEEKNVPAVGVVAITFTNMAAEEMRTRLSSVKSIGDAFIGTIHSFANRIMKESGERYTLLTDEVDVQIHSELIRRHCKNLDRDRYLEYREVCKKVDRGELNDYVRDNFLTIAERHDLYLIELPLASVLEDLKSETPVTYGECCQMLMKKRGIITFDELLEKAKAYFERINAKLEYVFVDELQDVGTLEYSFIRSLNAENYFFVGDDYQSIYGFKGGNVNIFRNLCKDETFTQYFMTNNYRNGMGILKLADVVISQVSNRIVKTYEVCSGIEDDSYTTVSRFQLDDVLNRLRREEDYREWFFLVRSNKELYEVSKRMTEKSIPHVTFKREGMSLKQLQDKMKSNQIKLLTVHIAKGLEADNVILYGNFPVYAPPYRMNDEERKVMYVGITRARRNLIIMN